MLKQIAHLLLQTLRFVDVVARYGGDEFALLLPETEQRAAGKIAARLLEEIRKSPFLHEGKVFHLSASMGISSFQGQGSAGALIKQADQALYTAKRGGRDRIVAAPKSPLESPRRDGEEKSEVPAR